MPGSRGSCPLAGSKGRALTGVPLPGQRAGVEGVAPPCEVKGQSPFLGSRCQMMAEEDALPFDNFKGCICSNYPDARVVGGRYSGSDQMERKNVDSAKELWDSLESKYMAEDAYSKKFLCDRQVASSWMDFKHSLKHGKDDLSLVQLASHLCIKEPLRAHESDKVKGKEVARPLVNMLEEGGKNKNNKQNKGKKRGFKDNNGGSGSNKKPKLEC
uniref:Zinc finger, CCHC-type n=1 Tax=Tanacetum cinerariifolium TaxID=118510 RepID=A0A6L2P5C4_TANCI|nr:hypothetical protein [Tanacetum cinerariifolium]